MKTPKRIEPLVEAGLGDEVMRPLMRGKEAEVYVVRCGDELRCAKVYKEANKRSFRQAGAGVRVPKPYDFLEGVLLMELVLDDEGNVAPRLNDVDLHPEDAREFHAFMIGEVVKMLCAGLVHGDLSEFNVLLAPEGPVIIDLPQAVDAAANSHAFSMLERDVGNMAAYFGQFAPELKFSKYAKEMWALYEAGELTPDSQLTGEFDDPEEAADIDAVMREIKATLADEARRQALLNAEDAPLGEEPPPPWAQ